MSFSVFVGVEGFTLPQQFIVKELTLLFENGEFNHTMFAPPLGYTPTTQELATIRHTTEHVHGIPFTEGDMPYAKLHEILSKLHNYKVYCYGENTKKLLQNHILFTPVINIQREGFKMPQLEASCCGRYHPGRHCSMSKAIAVKTFVYGNI